MYVFASICTEITYSERNLSVQWAVSKSYRHSDKICHKRPNPYSPVFLAMMSFYHHYHALLIYSSLAILMKTGVFLWIWKQTLFYLHDWMKFCLLSTSQFENLLEAESKKYLMSSLSLIDSSISAELTFFTFFKSLMMDSIISCN